MAGVISGASENWIFCSAARAGDREEAAKISLVSVGKCAQLMKPGGSLALDIDCMSSGDPLTSPYRRLRAGANANQSSQVDAVHRPMRISDLSKRTNLKAHTIRFYEKEGLLPMRYVQRKKNNYREYAEEAVNRLLLIKEGQLAGFSIAELRELTNGDESNSSVNEKQVVLIERKLASIDRKIGRLETFKVYLAQRLALLERKNGLGV
jgi:MerR family transcriptional regulator, copper efflux regulator